MKPQPELVKGRTIGALPRRIQDLFKCARGLPFFFFWSGDLSLRSDTSLFRIAIPLPVMTQMRVQLNSVVFTSE